jgi:hypothetical protein
LAGPATNCRSGPSVFTIAAPAGLA